MTDDLYHKGSVGSLGDTDRERLTALVAINVEHRSRIAQLEAELAKFQPMPDVFTADQVRRAMNGELTQWIKDGTP